MVRGTLPLLIAASAVLIAGCEAQPQRAPRAESRYDYPNDRPSQLPVEAKDENPGSQVWPLDLWLVEFEKRNGVELHYRDRDTFDHDVLSPGPGPFDSDALAMMVLRRVCYRNGLLVVEERPHVYTLRRKVPVDSR
ncbi:hypothetical protein HY251_03130 [bacterium]|nr:hypothetical protein [bacterium]